MYKEIRIFSRGGQGGVTGAKLLALAASLQNFEVQAIPKYGSERKGAPIFVDVRISDRVIKTHSPVTEADHMIVLEPSLIHKLPNPSKDVLLIVNSKEIEDFSTKKPEMTIGIVDAYTIAKEENLVKSGTAIVSTIMLGAWCKATNEFITLENIEKAIFNMFEGKLAEQNIRAIRKAFQEFKLVQQPELVLQ